MDLYAPWCQHCQALAPELEEAARELITRYPHENSPPEKQIFIGLVDCTVEADLKRRFNVQGYPTLLTYRAKTGTRVYRGPRTAKGIVEHMAEQLKPAVKAMPNGMGDLMTIMSPGGSFANSVSFIFLASGTGEGNPKTLTPRSAKAQQIFQDVAMGLVGVAHFFTPQGLKSDSYLSTLSNVSEATYAAEDAKAEPLCEVTASLAKRLGVQTKDLPAVVAVSPDLPLAIFTRSEEGEFTEDNLFSWVKDHKLPLINTLSPVNFEDVTSSGKLTVFIAIDPSHQATPGYIRDLIPVARAFHHNFTFATIDAIQFASYVSQFGIQRRHLPSLFGLDYAGELVYVDASALEAGVGMYTPEEQRNFLSRLAQGEVLPKGLVPWYSPQRYQRMLEKFLGQFTETQLLIGFGIAGTLASAFMIWMCCLVWKDQPPQHVDAISQANQDWRAQREAERAALVRNVAGQAAGHKKKQ